MVSWKPSENGVLGESKWLMVSDEGTLGKEGHIDLAIGMSWVAPG